MRSNEVGASNSNGTSTSAFPLASRILLPELEGLGLQQVSLVMVTCALVASCLNDCNALQGATLGDCSELTIGTEYIRKIDD